MNERNNEKIKEKKTKYQFYLRLSFLLLIFPLYKIISGVILGFEENLAEIFVYLVVFVVLLVALIVITIWYVKNFQNL